MSPLLALACLAFLPAVASAWPPRLDAHGDPLPAGAVARFGTVRWRHESVIRAAVWAPDGKAIWTNAEDRTVRAWDPKTGRETARPDALRESWKLSLSADGRLVAGLRSNEAVVLDLQTGKSVTIPLAGYQVGGFALSPDGKVLALGDLTQLSGEMNPIELRDVMTGKSLHRIPAHTGGVRTLAFTPDGKQLISAGADGHVRLWETGKWTPLPPPPKEEKHIQGAWCVHVSADGKTLASSAEDVRLWDLSTGRLRRVMKGHQTEVFGVSLSPDGRRVASIGGDRTLRLWDADSGKELWQARLNNPMSCTSPAFSPDGKQLAIGDNAQAVKLFDVATGNRLNAADGHEAILTAFVFSRDGRWLATTGYDSRVCLWDVGGKKLAHAMTCPGYLRTLLFAPDGKTLAGAGGDGLFGHIWLWDVGSGKQMKRLEIPGTPSLGCEVHGLAFSTDGKRLTGQTISGQTAWDVETGKVSRHLPGQVAAIRQPLSPDGTLTAQIRTTGWERMLYQQSTGSGIQPYMTFPIAHTVTLSDAASGLPLAKFVEETTVSSGRDHFLREQYFMPMGRARPVERLHPLKLASSVQQLSFSPDSKLLFMQGQDAVQMRELASGKVLWRSKGQLEHGLWFTPDGRIVGLSSASGQIVLYDAWTGETVGNWRPPVDQALHALSPDSRWLATAHNDSSILLWDLAELARNRPGVKPAATDELEKLWTDLLAEEPAKAFTAMNRLATSNEAVPFLRKQLQPGPAAEEERVAALIGNLNSRRFPVRESATRELKKLGAAARPGLAATLTSKPTLEVRRRIELLLSDDKVPDRLVLPGEPLRRCRVVQVLERSGSKEARALLESLAAGSAHAPITKQANTALQRLADQVRY